MTAEEKKDEDDNEMYAEIPREKLDEWVPMPSKQVNNWYDKVGGFQDRSGYEGLFYKTENNVSTPTNLSGFGV